MKPDGLSAFDEFRREAAKEKVKDMEAAIHEDKINNTINIFVFQQHETFREHYSYIEGELITHIVKPGEMSTPFITMEKHLFNPIATALLSALGGATREKMLGLTPTGLEVHVDMGKGESVPSILIRPPDRTVYDDLPF